MPAIPKTKVEELIRKLEPYMDSMERLDSFTLRKYKKEATENLSSFPWAGHIALGMLAMLEFDDSSLDASYLNALHFRNDAFTHAHYANALMLIGRFEEALRELLVAVEKEPENLRYLREAIDAAKAIGQFKKAESLHIMLTQRAPGQFDSEIEKIQGVAEVLEFNKMSEEMVAHCNAIAFGILRRSRVKFVSTRIETDTQDNYIMFYIDVVADEDVVEKLDDELGIELFEKVPDFHPDKYWVGYTSALAIS